MKYVMKKCLQDNPYGPCDRPVEQLEMPDDQLAQLLSLALPQVMDGIMDPDIAGRSPDVYITNLCKGKLGDFSKRIILVARDDRQIVGLLIALPDKSAQMRIYTLGVSPLFRNQGVGACLMHSLFAHLQGLGYGKVILDVHQQNIPAIRLYHKLGFAITNSVK